MRKKMRRPSPALVISSIALFVALSGVAVANLQIRDNSINTRDIKDGQVNTNDLRDNSALSRDIRDNQVNTKDIRDGSVYGSDVVESSLDQVPSAATADNATSAANAATVGGQSITKVAFRTGDNGGPNVVFNAGGLTIVAQCTAGQVALTAISGKQDSSIYVYAVDVVGLTSTAVDDDQSGGFDAGDTLDLLAGQDGNGIMIQFEFDATDGSVATGALAVDEDGGLGGCRVTGHITAG